MGSWKGRGNQYLEFARVVYCKLPTNSKQLPAFPLKAVTGIEPQPQRWEARVLPLCHRGPLCVVYRIGLASADLSCVKLEIYCVFFPEPSSHCIVYIFLEPPIIQGVEDLATAVFLKLVCYINCYTFCSKFLFFREMIRLILSFIKKSY